MAIKVNTFFYSFCEFHGKTEVLLYDECGWLDITLTLLNLVTKLKTASQTHVQIAFDDVINQIDIVSAKVANTVDITLTLLNLTKLKPAIVSPAMT